MVDVVSETHIKQQTTMMNKGFKTLAYRAETWVKQERNENEAW